jgi:hypothetical protein
MSARAPRPTEPHGEQWDRIQSRTRELWSQ